MALRKMYAGVNGSPSTTLAQAITAADTTIALTDASVLPAGPGIATIGVTAEAELITYTAQNGNSLTGVLRGVNGTTAAAWGTDAVVYRAYSTYDHDTFIYNLNELDGNKLSEDGDGSGVTVAFEAAPARANIETGESAATLFGKIAKWFSDLKAGAFASIGSGAGQVAAGNHTHTLASLGAEASGAAASAVSEHDASTSAHSALFGAKVDKVTGKGLSSNDYTTGEKTKLTGIEDNANNYVHPAYTARASGLYKVTVDAKGHVSAVSAVEKSDITGLGIPAQDTTYPAATTTANGLMASGDKQKLDGIETGAQKNVQADWNAASGDAFIKNKPALVNVYMVTVSLPASGWDADGKTQTVSVSRVTASNLVYLSPAESSFEAWQGAQIRCSAQGAGTLTFACGGDVPTDAVTYNVAVVEGAIG